IGGSTATQAARPLSPSDRANGVASGLALQGVSTITGEGTCTFFWSFVLVLAIKKRFFRTTPRTREKKRAKPNAPHTASRPRRRRSRVVRYLVLAVGVVLIIDALVGDRGLLAMLKARQQYRTLEASLARSKAENAQLREQARRLREDPDAVEEIARRE